MEKNSDVRLLVEGRIRRFIFISRINSRTSLLTQRTSDVHRTRVSFHSLARLFLCTLAGESGQILRNKMPDGSRSLRNKRSVSFHRRRTVFDVHVSRRWQVARRRPNSE